MKKIWAVLLLAFSLVIFAEPSLSKTASAQASSTDRFGQADLDSDDQLSPDEFGKAFDEIQPSAFGVLDKNSDGNIDRSEWDQFMGQHQQKKEASGQDSKAPANHLIAPPQSKAPAKP